MDRKSWIAAGFGCLILTSGMILIQDAGHGSGQDYGDSPLERTGSCYDEVFPAVEADPLHDTKAEAIAAHPDWPEEWGVILWEGQALKDKGVNAESGRTWVVDQINRSCGAWAVG